MIKLIENKVKMFKKYVLCAIFLTGLMPAVALGSMYYSPSYNRTYKNIDYKYERQNTSSGSQEKSNNYKQYSGKQNTSNNINNSGWYASGSIALNMWSWNNTYSSDYYDAYAAYNKDTYSLKQVLGANLAVGKVFNDDVRGDVEIGMSAQFSDADDIAEFKLSTKHLMINVYRDFESGLYVGAGLGFAQKTAVLTSKLFEGGEIKATSQSPKIGLSLGYMRQIDDNMFVDFRYRLSRLQGSEKFGGTFWVDQGGTNVESFLHVDSSSLLENAFSVGLRYNF